MCGQRKAGFCFKKAVREGETVIHFRTVLFDCEKEAGSPYFPPRNTCRHRVQRRGKQRGRKQSFLFFLLCFQPLNLGYHFHCVAPCLPGGSPRQSGLWQESLFLPLPGRNTLPTWHPDNHGLHCLWTLHISLPASWHKAQAAMPAPCCRSFLSAATAGATASFTSSFMRKVI